MKYNQLAVSDLRVSAVSMGCMSLKSIMAEAPKVIDQAIEFGINFFDTADLYEFGRNEELLGQALGNRRQDVIIGTKVGNEWTPAKDSWRWNPSKAYILKAIEGSLKRLKTDYIDLYQLHGGTIDDPIEETIEAFEILKEQGKIKEYGISSIRPNVIREYVQRANIVSVMMQYSLLDRRPEEALLDFLGESKVSVIVRGALAKGLLVNKSANNYLGLEKDAISEMQSAIAQIAGASSQSNSQIASQFVLQQSAVASAAIGFRTENQVSELLEGFDSKALSRDAWFELTKLRAVNLYTDHR